jgi:hypothetical protein
MREKSLENRTLREWFTRRFTNVLVIVLAVSLGLPSVAQAQLQPTPATPPPFNNIDLNVLTLNSPTEVATPDIFLDPSTPEFYEKFSSPLLGVLAQMPKDVQEGFSLELLEFYAQAAAYRQSLVDKYGEDRLVEILEFGEKDQNGKPLAGELNKEGFGKAEIYLIDDIPVIRIVHKPSETAVFFIDDPRVDKNSVHLTQVISRQFMISNQPKPGVHKGYDVVIARITPDCEGGACDITGQAKPIKFLDRVKHYENAYDPIYLEKTGEKWWQKKITDQALKLMYGGALTGSYQAAVLLAMGSTYEQAGFTFGFSIFSQLILPGFRRWTNSGAQAVFNKSNWQFELPPGRYLPYISPSKWQEKGHVWTFLKDIATKPMRRSTQSWGFRLGLNFLGIKKGQGFNLSFESVMGIANLWTNVLASNANSSWWIEPVRLRAKHRENKKPFFKPAANTSRSVQKKMYQMDSAEENVRYNMLWTVYMADVMGLAAIHFTIPETNIVVAFSAWKAFLISMAAVGRWRAVRFAERENYPEAPTMRDEFEKTFYVRTARWLWGDTGATGQENLSESNPGPTVKKYLVDPYKAVKSSVGKACVRAFNLNY